MTPLEYNTYYIIGHLGPYLLAALLSVLLWAGFYRTFSWLQKKTLRVIRINGKDKHYHVHDASKPIIINLPEAGSTKNSFVITNIDGKPITIQGGPVKIESNLSR